MKTFTMTTLLSFLLIISGLTFARPADKNCQGRRHQCVGDDCQVPPPPPSSEITPPPPPSPDTTPPPPPHPKKGQRGKWDSPRRQIREKIENKLQRLRKNNPEEFEKLMKLRRENPRAFRQEVHKHFKEEFKKEHPEAFKKMQVMAANRKKIHKLKKRYSKCESDEEKAEIKKKIRKLLSQNFDINQELREKEIGALDKKSKALRKRLRQQAKKKKEIVERRLNNIINFSNKRKNRESSEK